MDIDPTEAQRLELQALVGRVLVDITAIAQRLEVPKDTVNKWRYRGLLPDPDCPLSVGPVWEWETIRRWAESTGRLGG